ncbi:hypothetical protein ACWD4J_24235 [Streptomyces sp. NPDC002577]
MSVPEAFDDRKTAADLADRLNAETRFGDIRSRGGALADLGHALSDVVDSVEWLSWRCPQSANRAP